MATALLVIDVQMGFVERCAAGLAWGNPKADTKIAAVIAGFRDKGGPIFHVTHHALDPTSVFHPTASGSAVQACAAPLVGEAVVIKHRSSAFAATKLEAELRAAGIDRLVVIGGAVNYCVESTVRAASDLGFQVVLVEDALINHEARLRDGRRVPAPEVLAMTLANLDGEFAQVVTSAEV